MEKWLEKIETYNLELEYGGEVDYPHSKSWYVFDPTGFGIEVALWNQDEIRFDPIKPVQENPKAA